MIQEDFVFVAPGDDQDEWRGFVQWGDHRDDWVITELGPQQVEGLGIAQSGLLSRGGVDIDVVFAAPDTRLVPAHRLAFPQRQEERAPCETVDVHKELTVI